MADPTPLHVMWQEGAGQPLQPQTTRWDTTTVPQPVLFSLYDEPDTLDPNPGVLPRDLVNFVEQQT